MSKITYKFCDGTTSEVEVSDELYSLHEQLLQQEKRNHWRETRRHVSLEYLNELGVDFEDSGVAPLDVIIRREDDERLHKAFAHLSDKQQELVEKVYFKGMTLIEIAKAENVSQPAISQRLATVLKKLKKFL